MSMKNSRWLSLIVLCTGFLLIVVDMTIVNVALPSIQKDLGFSQSGLAWVINAYLIAFGGLLLLAGRIGDLVGRKRVFLAGLAIFTAASLLCGLSFTQPMLIAARFIQGIGGAVSSAVWHWIFFVNLPIGILTAVLATRLLETDRGIGLGRGADVLGAIMVTAALMLGVYTIVQTSDYGLASPRTIALGAVAIALLAAFVVHQARGRNPILPLRIFRSRRVTGANIVQALMSTAFISFFFLGSLDLQRVLGYGPMAIGLAFLPVAIVMALFSIRFSARLIARFGAGAMLGAGLVTALVALLVVGLGPTNANYFVYLLTPMVLFGLGGGLAFPALTMLAMADVSPSEAGLASGLLNTTGQVGGAFGLAVLATVAGARTLDLVHSGVDGQAALAGGYHFAWLIGAGVVAVTIAVAVAMLRSPARAPAESAPAACEAAA